jgi:hypothetical protein
VSAEQQHELLALAGRQGVLYAYQLPVLANGSPVDPSRQLLARILGGASAELQPLHAEPVTVGDPELDALQREAVAKALATPDILLVQGRSGTGKSRVVAEIIACAAARGQRVLLLAPSTAAIDRVLACVASRDVVLPVRCVNRDENVAALPAAIRALTFTERVRALRFHALQAARQQTQADEQLSSRLRQDEACWAPLEELAQQWQELEAQCHALENQRHRLTLEITEQANAISSLAADGFARRIGDLTRSHQETRLQAETRSAELHGRIDSHRQEQAALDAELHALEPLALAKQHGRWWTAAWWRATLHGKSILARWTHGQQRRQQIQTDLDALHEQVAVRARLQEEAENVFTSKKAGLIAAEVARRQAELEDRQAALRREQSILQQKWHHLHQGMAPESPWPAEMSPQAVQAARLAWRRQLEQLAEQRAFAQQWSAYLEQAPTTLATRLPGYINLVAATLTALPRDEHFGDRVATSASRDDFDLLILEEADRVSESEFLHAARRARRCVLVGEAPGLEESIPVPRQPSSSARQQKGPSSIPRSRAPMPARPALFQRLWQQLHCDPRQLPYTWMYEKDRLCCRLRPVPAEQQQWITIEHVADCPDIELRILSAPGCPPVLTEIVFPPSFSLDRAKQYIFQELEELAVQPTASSLHWLDQGDRLVLRLADRDLAHGLAIDLVPGIREILGTAARAADGGQGPAATWQTCCLEFDRVAGWDRPRAGEWVREHLGLRDLGRTIRLDVCYRMETRLAAFVADFLSGDAPTREAIAQEMGTLSLRLGEPSPFSAQAGEQNGWSAPVEFVPVPALREAAGVQERANTNTAQRKVGLSPSSSRPPQLSRGRVTLKGGAGLEIDLAEPRHRERLPAELRSDLPNQGFVNYPEAQAVVRTLADLLPETRPQEREWGAVPLPSRGLSPPVVARSPDHATTWGSTQPAVAILALYPAQAELIRRLLRQDPALAAWGDEIEVGIPADFRHREADVVLLSLTRSHTHRAVAFGDGPQMLALAMTRARSKLIIFGDPGTLLRRSQWEGPLEDLNEEAANRERQLISRLAHCLQGQGPQPQATSGRQGSGT